MRVLFSRLVLMLALINISGFASQAKAADGQNGKAEVVGTCCDKNCDCCDDGCSCEKCDCCGEEGCQSNSPAGQSCCSGPSEDSGQKACSCCECCKPNEG